MNSDMVQRSLPYKWRRAPLSTVQLSGDKRRSSEHIGFLGACYGKAAAKCEQAARKHVKSRCRIHAAEVQRRSLGPRRDQPCKALCMTNAPESSSRRAKKNAKARALLKAKFAGLTRRAGRHPLGLNPPPRRRQKNVCFVAFALARGRARPGP